MNAFDTAKMWQWCGIPAIPIQLMGKRPLVKWSQYRDRLPTDKELKRWFDGRRVNLGVVCGVNNLTVIDFDQWSKYKEWVTWGKGFRTTKALKQLTYQVMTARGVHVYLYLIEQVGIMPLDGVDIKQDGYVLAPPSIHPTGQRYVAVDPDAPILTAEKLTDVIPGEWIPEPPPQPQHIEQPPLDLWDVVNDAKTGQGGVEIAVLKQRISITDILPHELEPSGNGHYITRCPLHDDNNPSMWVNLDDKICGCYAGCTDKPLDVINLYARMNRINNDAAIRELSRR